MAALPTATPRSQGVDACAIEGFVDALADDGIELHSLMLLRHGHVVAEAYWAPYASGQINLLYSLSKSFVSMAAGIAVAEGRFGLGDRVVDVVPEFVPEDVDDRWRRVTVRDCLRMATGHLDDPWLFPQHRDWLAEFLRLAPESAPGSVFTYNQLATYTVGRIVTATTGQRLLDYLEPRLLEPLGVTRAAWLTDGRGRDCGFSGLHVTTDAVARLGQLLLQGGKWDGRQLVPADWIEQATTVQMPNDGAHRRPGAEEPAPDWGRGYGYQFWMCRHGFRGDGALGQFCVVLPEEDAVLALTAETDRMQVVLDALWEQLLPGVTGGGSEQDDARLATRLQRVAIATPPDDEGGTGTGELRRSGGDAAPSVQAISIDPDGAGWVARLTVGERVFRLPIGNGSWAEGVWLDDVSLPFRSAGGWRDGRFIAQLRMVRTPHTIELVADPQAGTAALAWRFPPLHGAEPEAHSIPGV